MPPRTADASPAGPGTTGPATEASLPLSLLHLVTLYALAVAQPLLSLLGKNPEFFITRQLGTAGVIWLPLALLLLPPLPAVLLRIAAQPLGLRCRRVCQGLLVAMPVMAFLLYAASRELALVVSGPVSVVASAALALGFAWLYHRHAELLQLVTYLGIAIVAVPAVFILNHRLVRDAAPAAEVAVDRPAPAAEQPAAVEGAGPPIVMVVFDELSTLALLGADGTIDADRFPNFAALAELGSWYREASAVSAQTVTAVPAILTGRMPRLAQLPILADHPDNLFTRLEGRYRLVAHELLTELCPEGCEDARSASEAATSSARTLGLLAQDLGIVYLHLILPAPYNHRLPPIDDDWGGFAAAGWSGIDYPGLFHAFLDTLGSGGDGTVFFHHSHLPHQPYEYLPSGESYVRPAPVIQLERSFYSGQAEYVYRRYLLQVQLVDRLVGELLERLRSEGMLDDCLLVVTADHGPRYLRRNSFDRPTGRSDDKAAYVPFHLQGPGDAPLESEWAFVPLFIKRPGQTAGEIVDTPVSSLDIVPTVLAELGLFAELEGSDPFEGLPVDRVSADRPRQVYTDGKRRPLTEGLSEERAVILQWKLANFGEGSDPKALYQKASPRPDLLGHPLDTLPAPPAGVRILVDGADGPTDTVAYDPTSGEIPTLIRGAVLIPGATDDTPPPVVAIAIDGTIQATVQTFAYKPGHYRFAELLPDWAVRAGENRVGVGWAGP